MNEKDDKPKPVELCRHGKDHNLIDPHYCPYQSDVNDDDNPEYCQCCDDCMSDCAGDI